MHLLNVLSAVSLPSIYVHGHVQGASTTEPTRSMICMLSTRTRAIPDLLLLLDDLLASGWALYAEDSLQYICGGQAL